LDFASSHTSRFRPRPHACSAFMKYDPASGLFSRGSEFLRQPFHAISFKFNRTVFPHCSSSSGHAVFVRQTLPCATSYVPRPCFETRLALQPYLLYISPSLVAHDDVSPLTKLLSFVSLSYVSALNNAAPSCISSTSTSLRLLMHVPL
jgi:hypothetical protein